MKVYSQKGPTRIGTTKEGESPWHIEQVTSGWGMWTWDFPMHCLRSDVVWHAKAALGEPRPKEKT